ncbi:MAG: hypothetical protein ACLU9S_22965 [Oscillospiraceae bacterium]
MPVPTPETGDWLSGLHVGPTKTVAFQSDKAFSPDCHAYTYRVGSNVTSFGVLADAGLTPAGDCAINGYYPDYRYWNDAYGLRTLNAVSGKFKSSTTFLGASGEGNEMRLEVSRESGGVTYYQDYFLTAQRLLQLNDLALSTEGQALVLKQDNAEETPKFDKETLAYKVAVGQTQSSVTLDVKLLSTGSGNDNAFTVTASCGANQETLDYSVLPVQEALDRSPCRWIPPGRRNHIHSDFPGGRDFPDLYHPAGKAPPCGNGLPGFPRRRRGFSEG